MTLIGQHPRPTVFGSQYEALQDQRCVDGRVEESFQLAVLVDVAAQLADPLEAVGVAAKDQKFRRLSDPRHVGHERREAIAALAAPDPNDAGLLEIRFRGGRKGRSQQQAQQGFGHGAFGITPMGTPHQDLAQPWQIG
jgi:hypothetical protein